MQRFTTDYRDVVLYNGRIPFKATGRFNGTYMEIADSNGNVTYFNVNVDCNTYSNNHINYEIFRFKDEESFKGYEVTLSSGRYCPTGRWYNNSGQRLWELMRENDESDVLYLRMPPFDDSNFNIGSKAI